MPKFLLLNIYKIYLKIVLHDAMVRKSFHIADVIQLKKGELVYTNCYKVCFWGTYDMRCSIWTCNNSCLVQVQKFLRLLIARILINCTY